MIHALLQVLAAILGLPLVLALGYVLLRALRRQHEPSENACLAAGALAWLLIGFGVAVVWLAL